MSRKKKLHPIFNVSYVAASGTATAVAGIAAAQAGNPLVATVCVIMGACSSYTGALAIAEQVDDARVMHQIAVGFAAWALLGSAGFVAPTLAPEYIKEPLGAVFTFPAFANE